MRPPAPLPPLRRIGGSGSAVCPLIADHGCPQQLVSLPQLVQLPQRRLRIQSRLRPIAYANLPGLHAQARAFSKTTPPRSASATAGSSGTSSTNSTSHNGTTASPEEDEARLKKSYFLSNGILNRVAGLGGAGSATSSERSSQQPANANPELLPHRRRQAARRQAQSQAAAKASSSSSTATADAAADNVLPANASTTLTDLAARQPASSFRRTASVLLSLTKPRLTVLVVLTAMAPYALYPVPAFLSPELVEGAAPSLSPLTLLFLTTGTALCSASANALNMLYELDTDARMSRTRNRPLVRALISRRAALAFAVVCGLGGVAALHFGVNPTVAFLGGANIALYAGVYTPMKRLSVWNTWVGGLVGGIPPLMGWAAAAGEAATGATASGVPLSPGREFRELLFASDGSSLGGWLLAGLLFAWQFPHFMALSWGVRAEYQRAGLKMLCWVNPARNARVALRYSLAFVPLCVGLCAVGVTEWSFAVTSLPVNLWLVREAVRFWRLEGASGSARGLFWASVWHLPAVMVLALLQKKGMWARVWRSVAGQPTPDADEDDEFGDEAFEDGWEEEDEEAQSKSPLSAAAALPAAVSAASSSR